jgi:5'(3')-deoxyribonucleotidase
MNIGIDIGGTIKDVRYPDGTIAHSGVAPHSFRVINELRKKGHVPFIISKVTTEQKDRAEKWIESTGLYPKTGIRSVNVYFCHDRKDKAIFVKALDIGVMIDDRAEVIASLEPNVFKLLITPEAEDFARYKHRLVKTELVSDWEQIETILDSFFARLTNGS